MNKLEADNVRAVAERAKKCLLGKIETDINSRLPPKPEKYNAWEKYKMIKAGVALLRKDLRVNDLMDRYKDLALVEAFTYPASDEQKTYEKASKAIQAEKQDRELAVELAFNRAVDERIFGLLDSKGFLDTIETLASKTW